MKSNSILAFLLFAISLALWIISPIYPDEIALRIGLSRGIQDQGVVRELFSLCSSQVHKLNFMTIVPSTILSFIDLNTNPAQMRLYSLATYIGILIVLVRRYGSSFPIILISISGVACSGLILVRHELYQIPLLMMCILISSLDNKSVNKKGDYFRLIILMIAFQLALFVHLESVILIPVSCYVVYLILRNKIAPTKALIFSIIIFITSVYYDLKSHSLLCDEYKEIGLFWKSTLHLYPFNISFFVEKFKAYSGAFIFKENYAIGYIPGILDSNNYIIKVFNFIIKAELISVIIINIIIAINTIKSIAKSFYSLRVTNAIISTLENKNLVTSFLIGIPALLLLTIDADNNFYRSFYINILLVISSIIYLSSLSSPHKNFIKIFSVLLIILTTQNILLNYKYFYTQFLIKSNNLGPSMSYFTDWEKVDLDLENLIKENKLDFSVGGIIVDDYTYNSLKKYRNIFPVTYLLLQRDIIKKTAPEVLFLIKPNYALIRCGYLQDINIKPLVYNGLCLFNFRENK